MPLTTAVPATLALLWSGKLLGRAPAELLTPAMAAYATLLAAWTLFLRSRAWGGVAMGRWTFGAVPIGLAAALLAVIGSGAGYVVSQRTLGLTPPPEAALIQGPGYRLIAGVGIAVAAAILEEWVFRGVLLSRLEMMPAGWAVVASAALFAAYHLSGFQLLPTFILGLILATVALRGESLWVAVIAHAVFNVVALTLSAFATVPGSAG